MRRKHSGWLLLTAILWGAAPFRVVADVVIQPPFDAFYALDDLGAIPGVPANYGGVNFALGNFNRLIIGGSANNSNGALYSIGVVRSASGHITSFNGSASVYASGPYNDGGLAYGPGNVLFMSQWPLNELSQFKPGSTAPDKTIDLGSLGVEVSHSALNFVPSGFSAAGHLKLVSYSAGQWSDAAYTADGTGTFNITSVTPVADSRLGGGPEGFFYVPPLSPGFSSPSMLVAEYQAGNIAAYQVDANADPIISTRQVFLSGLTGAEGSLIDPVTGDLLFSTFGGGNHLVVVHGFVADRLGDFNRDGQLTLADLPAMLAALTDLDHYKSQHGFTDADLIALGDINHSGKVDNVDIQALANLIVSTTGGGSMTSVPEPSSRVLFSVAILGVAVRAKTRRPR